MTNKKGKAVPQVTLGARIPRDLARKLKSILVGRGDSIQNWLMRVATAEADGTIAFGVGHPAASRPNAAPDGKSDTTGAPDA